MLNNKLLRTQILPISLAILSLVNLVAACGSKDDVNITTPGTQAQSASAGSSSSASGASNSTPEGTPEKQSAAPAQPAPIAVASSRPSDPACPPILIADDNCNGPYLGMGVLDLLALDDEILKAGDVVSEASTGSDVPACVPHLEKFVKDVQHAWFHEDCKAATFAEIQKVINDASQDKEFCRHLEAPGQPVNYDLFNLKRIRSHVIQTLKERYPSQCK